jgi:GrpB-like predicted nucleotidyltransferase (UPF0157 family)
MPENNALEKAIASKYKFRKYSSSYPKIFLSQKRFLSKTLKSIPKKEIHHIGSTSVPNLGGKRVIDIIVVVPKKSISRAKKLLKKSGFIFNHSMRERYFFQKYCLDSSNVPRFVHLHLTHFDSGELRIALAFRDYLRFHKKTSKEYEKIKRFASNLHSANGKKYAEHKFDFIEKTVKKALKWYKE